MYTRNRMILKRESILITVLICLALSLIKCGTPNITIQNDVVYPDQKINFIPTTYLIGPGDALAISFYYDPDYLMKTYIIDIHDTLKVDFYYYSNISREVKVRPDGFITLPLIGDVKAIGKSPMELAADIAELYKPHLTRPEVTIELIESRPKLDELKNALFGEERIASQSIIVSPQGLISLPYLGDVRAMGLTTSELTHKLKQQYQRTIKNIDLTVSIVEANSNEVFVMGQVQKPNFYKLIKPTTVIQALSMAGGLTDAANTHQIMVISRNDEGNPAAQILDMDNIIGKGNIGDDVLLKQGDVIFVPHTSIAAAATVGDALWRLIPVRFGSGLYYRLD